MHRNEIDPSRWTFETDFFKRRALREAEVARWQSGYPNRPRGGLISYGDWLFERNEQGLPTDIAPPSHVEPVDAWRTRMIGTPEILPATADATHPVFRGPGQERAQRLAALSAFYGGEAKVPAAAPAPTPPQPSAAQRALKFVQHLIAG